MSERAFAVLATAIGILFLAITPPLQVPDEWNHYVRAEAIGQGHLTPDMTWQGDCESFPIGIERFIRATYRTSGKFTLHELRDAAAIPLDGGGKSTLCFSAWYTPVPYVPQVIVVAASRALQVRPFVTFYAGRIVNLGFVILMIVASMRLAPGYRSVFAAVALLPMAMYQLASWSADAPTFAAAVLLTAVLLRAVHRTSSMTKGEVIAIAGLAMVVALCKPVYFLIALLVLAIPRRRFRSAGQRIAVIAAVVFAVALGVVTSSATAQRARYNARVGLPVDVREQARCVMANPLRFAEVAIDDLGANGTVYLEELVGRFGMNDVKLPMAMVWPELFVLVVAGLMSARPASVAQRLLTIMIALSTMAGVLLSQYLLWSVICGHAIEGVQGRYFLPIVPLALASFAVGPKVSDRVQSIAIVAVAVIANSVALIVLLQRYWL